MRQGFALLETMIVVTVLSVSLLMLYGTFTDMVNNNKNNILYDNVSNIYKTYFVKEYLELDKYYIDSDIEEVDCRSIDNKCDRLFSLYNIEKIYITKYDLRNVDTKKYGAGFSNYVKSLSNKDSYQYRVIVEYKNDNIYSYANMGFNYE